MGSVDTLCVGMCVYAFFGITLALSPRDFWGPESPLCYWTEMDAVSYTHLTLPTILLV